jgi:hypothetical protein
MPGHRFGAEVTEQTQQQRRMLLLFGDEKFCSAEVFVVPGQGGFA